MKNIIKLSIISATIATICGANAQTQIEKRAFLHSAGSLAEVGRSQQEMASADNKRAEPKRIMKSSAEKPAILKFYVVPACKPE